MGQVNNLNDPNFQQRVLDRLDKLERATPTNNAAIGRGGIEVYDGGVITITNGGLSVTGTATILGTLIASGIINFTGNVTISGPLSVSGLMTLTNSLAVMGGGKITAGAAQINSDGSATFGQFTIAANGDLTSAGALNINGPTTLNNNLTVAAGKKITLGSASLENQAGAGVLKLGGTSLAASAGTGMMLNSDGIIHLYGSGIEIGTLPVLPGGVANLRMDPTTGTVYRCT